MHIITRKAILMPEQALHIGVKLLGNCHLENGILSGFDTSPSRADLPFITQTWNCPWELVLKWRKTTNTGWQGLISAVTDSGWTPLGFQKGVVCFLLGVGMPIEWDTTTAEGCIAFDFTRETDYITRVAFDGNHYTVALNESGKWVEQARKTTTDFVSTEGQTINIGLNRGINSPFDGTVDLNFSYIRRNGTLLWEGIAGAYENVISINR